MTIREDAEQYAKRMVPANAFMDVDIARRMIAEAYQQGASDTLTAMVSGKEPDDRDKSKPD